MPRSFSTTGTTIVDTSADIPTASAAYEGVMVFQKDTNELKICDGASWIVASSMAAWNTYTPILYQGATVVSKTVDSARYLRMGKFAAIQVRMTVTGSGAANSGVQVSLPADLAPASRGSFYPQGVGVIYDASAAQLGMYAVDLVTYGLAIFFSTSGTFDNSAGNSGTTFSAALANNDRVGFTAIYEAT